MDYTIRLDVLTPTDGDLLKKYLLKYSKYLIYEETSDKVSKLHYQGIVYFDDMRAANAAKVRFTTMFPNHSRGKKSLSKVKSDNYEIYITKDGKRFVAHGYTEDAIKDLESKSYPKQSKRTQKPSWFNYLVERVKEAGCNASSNGWELASVVLDVYQKECKSEPNDFQIRCYCKSIQRHLVFEVGDENVYNSYIRARAKSIIGTEWTIVSL